MTTTILTYRGIGVGKQVPQHVDKMLALDQDVIIHVELANTNSCCLPDVRIAISETMSEGVNKDIDNLLDLNIAHSTNSQSTDKWVGVFDILSQCTTLETTSFLSLLCRHYLDERGHRHHGHVRLASRIVDKVQVHHFLDFKNGNVHNIEDIRKER